jgi:hypothetical protein
VTERSTIRLHPPVILWWVWVGFLVLNVVDYGVQGLPSARFGTVLASLLLLVTGLVYTLAVRPRLVEDGDGLTVVNPFRVTRLPWPAIQSVDTGEWVRVRYTRGPVGASRSSAVVHCWALYVSTSARRKLALGGAPRADRMTRRLRGLAAPPPSASGSGYGQPSSRLPDEARRLAALPVSAAIAARLDSRAEKERIRAESRAADDASAATTSWSWPALAAVAVPAVLLLVVALL